MDGSRTEENTRPQRMVLRMVQFGFALSCLIYALLGYIIDRQGTSPGTLEGPSQLSWVDTSLLIVAVAVFPILRVLRRSFHGSLEKRGPARDPERQAPPPGRIIGPYIILFALAELPAILGLVLFFLGSPVKILYLTVGISLVCLAFMTPPVDFFRTAGRVASLLLLVLVPAFGSPARAVDFTAPNFTDEVFAEGFSEPTALAFLKPRKLLVAEKAGRVILVKGSTVMTEPFLDISGQVDSGGDMGLLDVAVHPRYPGKPYVFVLYTFVGIPPYHRVSRFTVDGDTVLEGSEEIIFEMDAPGGTDGVGASIAFGDDGRLYIGTSDPWGGRCPLPGQHPREDPPDQQEREHPVEQPLLRRDPGKGTGHLVPGPPEPGGPGRQPRQRGPLLQRRRDLLAGS